MIESDHSDNESQDEMPPLEVSTESVNCNEPGQKRSREENSEDDGLHVASKKLCTSIDRATSEEVKGESNSEVNGNAEDVKDNLDDTNIKKAEEKIKSLSEEITSETKDLNVATNEAENTKDSIDNEKTAKKENGSDILTTEKHKENVSMESTASDLKELDEKEDDTIKLKKKRKKPQIEDAEVVEGLELSVECASDKESSSSSDNEDEKNKKPVPKTIIVKAKPNDSELDVSSSEAERSDSKDVPEVKRKQTAKKGKGKDRTSISKAKSSNSEENDENNSDEDYSPRAKKKLKKTVANKKYTKSPTESKKGRVKPKKIAKKSIEKEDEEDENSNITEEKEAEENVADVESVKSKSEDESDSADGFKDGSRKRQSSKAKDKQIEQLKKYIRMAGIYVKSYNDIWANCKSNATKVKCLKELLEKNGISGRPSIEKCKKAKEKNERLKDIAELNTSNIIISEGRVTRAQRNKDLSKESTKSPETPKRSTYKRVLSVVDSDSE